LRDASSARVALEHAASSANARLLRVARRRLRSREDAEECVQDAMLLACTRIDQLERLERLEPWLRSIVLNTCKMRLRGAGAAKRSTSSTLRLDDVSEPRCNGPCAEDALVAGQLEARVRRSIARRGAKHLRVLDALLDESQLDDYATLAARCGMTRSAFKTRVHRLRQDVVHLFDRDRVVSEPSPRRPRRRAPRP
jgi:RNA polymerase sigma factor (sigma-70 family)